MFGTIAGILTTLAFLPQVIKVVRTKDTKSISLTMYLMQVVGILLWAVHGFVSGDIAVAVANSITLVLSGIILVAKLRYK